MEVIAKPGGSCSVGDMSMQLAEKIRAASRIRMVKQDSGNQPTSVAFGLVSALAKTSNKVIAIGASTGGTEALKNVLSRMPLNPLGFIPRRLLRGISLNLEFPKEGR